MLFLYHAKKGVFGTESLLTIIDVRNEKFESTTDGCVTKHIEISTSVRFVTLNIPAFFISKVGYTVNHTYVLMKY